MKKRAQKTPVRNLSKDELVLAIGGLEGHGPGSPPAEPPGGDPDPGHPANPGGPGGG
jgi:hypothetical protein